MFRWFATRKTFWFLLAAYTAFYVTIPLGCWAGHFWPMFAAGMTLAVLLAVNVVILNGQGN